jgi:hypothetical protein
MRLKVNKQMCATCPWQKDSPYADLIPMLLDSAFSQASRICHCTGSNAINENTGKIERLCRGARDAQLDLLYKRGFLAAPTDEAWVQKCEELGLKPDNQKAGYG